MDAIRGFFGPYRYLSNFYPAPIQGPDGITYPTSEHAFQAAKTNDTLVRKAISRLATPGQAKRAGRTVELRPDWDSVKLDFMYHIVSAKFSQNPDLAAALIETGDMLLEETNRWGDTYWGVCNGKGENHLGRILMRVRSELANK